MVESKFQILLYKTGSLCMQGAFFRFIDPFKSHVVYWLFSNMFFYLRLSKISNWMSSILTNTFFPGKWNLIFRRTICGEYLCNYVWILFATCLIENNVLVQSLNMSTTVSVIQAVKAETLHFMRVSRSINSLIRSFTSSLVLKMSSALLYSSSSSRLRVTLWVIHV